MIEKFLTDGQDPKATEKVFLRLNDLLNNGEEILYLAVQKKPIVNLFPDCVALTNKRVLFFTTANLGLTLKFVDFVWKDIVDVSTKEEIIRAVFSVLNTSGVEMAVDYLPRVQARKLYQYAQERKETEREARRLRDLEEKRAESGAIQFENPATLAAFQAASMATPQPSQITVAPVSAAGPVHFQTPSPVAPVAAPVAEAKPDELTEKLKKLRMLFENSLITQEEYNHKKMELLSEL